MRRRLVWAVVASVILVGVMFIAGFPLHTYLQQRSSLATASYQLRSLANQNRSLHSQLKKLNTDAEIEKLARQYYGLVKPGEEAYAILPAPAPPKPATQAGPSRLPRHGDSQPTGLWSKITNNLSF